MVLQILKDILRHSEHEWIEIALDLGYLFDLKECTIPVAEHDVKKSVRVDLYKKIKPQLLSLGGFGKFDLTSLRNSARSFGATTLSLDH